jgi:hypothetical protein
MGMTTKSHLAEHHSVEQEQEDLKGIGDFGEDFGEQNHQKKQKPIDDLDVFNIF